ncbi:peptidyl-prolyl cis-trans isomerase [Rubrivirga sp.]|uniref:peptidyl-prolyl cis-trans isomerase n=1 Tax=Rubrivirga sp. TaxID=1885344 RepID=UPI003B52FFAF
MTARVLLLALAVSACGDAPADVSDGAAVARVGDAELTEADLADALGDAPAGLDSATVREQLVEQWVQRELLIQEARRQGLDDDPAVARRLQEAERSTLEQAALETFFEQAPAEPSDADLEAYYDRHRDALALREPYVRLRHLRLADASKAAEARASLARAVASPYPDSLFVLVAAEYADDPAGATAFAGEYVSEERIRSLDETLGERVARLSAGAEVAVVPVSRTVHLVQVVDRVPAGTVPPFRLVRDELAERLGVQMRRDAQARLLQRLRSEAQAAGRLAVR